MNSAILIGWLDVAHSLTMWRKPERGRFFRTIPPWRLVTHGFWHTPSRRRRGFQMGRSVTCYDCGVRFKRPANMPGPKFLCKKHRRGRSFKKTYAIIKEEARQ